MRRVSRIAIFLVVDAALARPLACALSPRFAAWNACPLTASDLERLRPDDDTDEDGLVSLSERDPWGQPFRFERTASVARVYSSGPNARDEHGAGDDIVLVPDPIFPWLTWAPGYLVGAALVLLWLRGTVRLARAPRSVRLSKELLRAAGMATLPVTVTTTLVAGLTPGTLRSTSLLGASFIPPALPLAGSIAFVWLLVALRIRARAAPTDEFEEQAPRRRRWPVLLLALVVLGAAGAWFTYRSRARLVAAARVGIPEAVDEICVNGDLALVRAFATDLPRGFFSYTPWPSCADAIARLGSDGIPARCEMIARRGVRYVDMDDSSEIHRDPELAPLDWDAELAQLSACVTERPLDFAGLLLCRTQTFVRCQGRAWVLTMLAPLLEDRREMNSLRDGEGPRVCDEAARRIARIAGGTRFYKPGDTLDPLLERIQAWRKEAGPAPELPPEGWIKFRLTGLNKRTTDPRGPVVAEIDLGLGDFSVIVAPSGTAEVTRRIGPYTAGPYDIVLTSIRKNRLEVHVTVPPSGTVALDADFQAGTCAVTSATGRRRRPRLRYNVSLERPMSGNGTRDPRLDQLIYDWNEAKPRPQRRRVSLNDETLRDGLQSPSVVDPKIEEKIEILHLMDKLRIDTADLGLPGAGPRAVADVTRLAEEIRSSKLRIRGNCAARTVIADVEPIVRIQDKTGVPIMAAMFIGSSEIRRYTEDWNLDRMLKHTEDAVRFAVAHNLESMYVTEDTTRAHPTTIDKLYRTAIECGARRICVCDTVGHADPHGVAALIGHVKELIRSTGEDVKMDWHGHNDRGLALENAIAAIEAGVDQVHGCALGIGERCGNMSMDLLIVNLRLMGYVDEEVDLRVLPRYVERVSQATHVPIPKNYPVVGKDAFETGTGVHAAAVIKAFKKNDTWLANRVYSGVPADVFGREQSITIGPMSGRSNVVFWLERRSIEPIDAIVDRIFEAAKRSNRILSDEEIYQLIRQPVDEWSFS